MIPVAGLQVRPAGEADLPQLVALCADHARYERAAPAAPSPAALLAAMSGPGPVLSAWCLADGTGQLHGYASGCTAFCTWSASTVFILDCLYLVPSARGRGDGRRLLQAVAMHARGRGCSRMEWVTPDWNEAAIGFYRALGAAAQPRSRFRLDLRQPAAANLSR